MATTKTKPAGTRIPTGLSEFIDTQIDPELVTMKDRSAVIRTALIEWSVARGWRPDDA